MSTTITAYPLPTFEIVDGPHWRDRDMDGRQWEHRAYRVRLTYDGRSIEVPWKQGTGITSDPEAHDVLGALIMDAQSIEASTGFPDWAEQYGYSPDSIAARDLYYRCREQSDALAVLLTRRLMVALMDDENATYGAAPRFALAWDAAVGRVAA